MSIFSSDETRAGGMLLEERTSDASKMIFPAVEISKWLSNRPFAPPSSKSAAVFWNRGSAAKSNSKASAVSAALSSRVVANCYKRYGSSSNEIILTFRRLFCLELPSSPREEGFSSKKYK